jgi:two-component sensor histidine kinase
MKHLPKFWELAENQLKYAGTRDKTINIKISINTARMMVEAESKKNNGQAPRQLSQISL